MKGIKVTVIRCLECGVEYTANHPSRKRCPECADKVRRARNAARLPGWQAVNRKKCAEYQRNYAKRHHDKARESQRKWEKNNPEKKKAQDARYLQRHKAEHNEQGKRWAANNPEAYRASRNQRNHNRRARLAQAEGKWSFKEFQTLCEASDNRCYYCQKQVDKLTADHMTPLARGGSNWIENIVPVCVSCNSSKGTSTLLEYFFPVLR